MKVVIVEDEKLAAERLLTLLRQADPSVEVLDCLESIEETVHYLRNNRHPELLLLDIHLSDGHSFEIFKQVNYNGPVIFTTAYDNYALEAFKLLSIDYILKPVTRTALASALNKLHSFSSRELQQGLSQFPSTASKKRFLGKIGQRLYFVETTSIAFFQAENKLVYMIDKSGTRYLVDHTMEKLEQLLDPRIFFRLNRKFIVSIEAILQVKPYYNSRLKLSVQGAGQQEEMVISRDRVSEFRQWAES